MVNVNKKKLIIIFYLFAASMAFAQKNIVESINFPSLMLSTKKIQNAVMEKVVSITNMQPVYFVITAYDESNRVSVFYDCISLEENNYAREMVCCTVPYFVADSFDKKLHISFSFAFLNQDIKNSLVVSECIYHLYLEGILNQIAENYSLNRSLEQYGSKRQINAFSVFSVTLVTILLIMIAGVIIWTIFYVKMNEARKEQKEKVIDEQLTKQLEKETIEKYESQLIEPVTGLFSSYYIKEQIKKEIMQFDVFGRNFSVAIFTTKETSDIQTIKKIAEIIKENLNSGVVTSYKGDGVFMVLFSNKESEEIGIFVDLVVEKIYQANISISSEIFDFKGQMTFLGRLGLDERNRDSQAKKNEAVK